MEVGEISMLPNCIGKKNSLPIGFGTRPWLFQMHGNKKQTTTFVDPMNYQLEEKLLPAGAGIQGKLCLGCYGEWILLSDEITRDSFFLSTISFSKIWIPPFPVHVSPDFFRANVRITSPPDTANCLVILVCHEKTFLSLCSPGSKRWKKVHLNYLTKKMDFLRGASVVYKSWLFVVTALDVTLAIDIASLSLARGGGPVKMTAIDRLKICPMGISWTAFLVNCADDDLFSVQLHSYGNGQILTHAEVRRLELSSSKAGSNEIILRWRRVQDIGDYTFFLAGRCGTAIPANRACGARRNCIYHPTNCSDGVRLYEFSLDDQILSFTFLTNTNYGDHSLNRLQWTFPTNIFPTTVEDTSNSVDAVRSTQISGEYGGNGMVTSRKWDKLPLDIIELLSARLSLVDCLRLPSVCKAWSQASTEKGKVWPWLMHLPNLKSRECKFFDPFYCKEYTMKTDALSASDHLALRFSKNGWVVVTEGNHRVFLFNPFTGQIFDDLPLLKDDYIFSGISFLSVPTCPDFVIFGFTFQVDGEFVLISKWCPGEEEWTTLEFWPSVPLFRSFSNPVLLRGEFYCLGRKGELGVFNPELETWTVLSKPDPIYPVEPRYGDEYCSLLEFNGDLISVFRTDDTQKEIRVFKLDQSEMVWRKVEHLGDLTLFVDRRNSIAIPALGKEYANKIYITRWGGNDHKKGIFYSMEDHKYYPSVHCVEEPISCVWMEPNLKTLNS